MILKESCDKSPLDSAFGQSVGDRRHLVVYVVAERGCANLLVVEGGALPVSSRRRIPAVDCCQ